MNHNPTPAQLRFLIHLIEHGGEAYADSFAGPTVRACRTQEWCTYQRPADPYTIGKHAITDAGRKAVDDRLALAVPPAIIGPAITPRVVENAVNGALITVFVA